jgi:hypothetical protein
MERLRKLDLSKLEKAEDEEEMKFFEKLVSAIVESSDTGLPRSVDRPGSLFTLFRALKQIERVKPQVLEFMKIGFVCLFIGPKKELYCFNGMDATHAVTLTFNKFQEDVPNIFDSASSKKRPVSDLFGCACNPDQEHPSNKTPKTSEIFK